MTNANIKVEGSKLIIEVNLDEEHGPSKSGKTIIVGTTHGAAPVGDDKGTKVSLNVYRSR